MGEIHSNLSGSAWHKTALARMCPQKAETPAQPAIEIERIDAFDRTLTHLIYESDNCILDLYIHRETPDIVNIDNQDFTFEIAVCDLPAWIALLQKAQQIIEGGKEP